MSDAGPALQPALDEDALPIRASHDVPDETGANRKQGRQVGAVIEGSRAPIGSKTVVHDPACNIRPLCLHARNDLWHGCAEFDELVQIHDDYPFVNLLGTLAHGRDRGDSAGHALGDVEIVVLNHLVPGGDGRYVLGQAGWRGDVELGDPGPVIVPQEVGQQAGIVEDADEQLYVTPSENIRILALTKATGAKHDRPHDSHNKARGWRRPGGSDCSLASLRMARFANQGLDHVAIGVADVERSRRFYEEVVGLER